MTNAALSDGDHEPGVQEPNQRASHNEVFDWFEEYVEKNKLQIGDDLPSEEFITKVTGVSRSSVREAITRLRAIGIIESRRRRGMRLLRSPRLLELIRLLSADQIKPEEMGHVGAFRCGLELGLCSEIFRRATPNDTRELREIFDTMVAHGNDPDAWNTDDRRFHEKLIYITGNKVAIWLSEMLVPFFDTLVSHVHPLPDHVRSLHEAIVTALESRDWDAFYQAIFEHNHSKLPYDLFFWFHAPQRTTHSH
jgi:DNA-binding FadR family transcriptional regulator